MREQSKAAKRRALDPAFTKRYFKGLGIDVGAGPDPLAPCPEFPLITHVRTWDLIDGDAQYMQNVVSDQFDFLHSSHCLEHVRDVEIALRNWLRIVKPGGFLVVTVPDEFLYESGRWPSAHNPDHKHSFTLRASPVIDRSKNVLSLLWRLDCDVERLSLLSDGWNPSKLGLDQTLGDCECSIEFVIRKPGLLTF